MKAYTHHTRGPQGFTLIELMIVVAVLAIVGALVVPMIGNNAPDKLRGAANRLVADLAFTKVESIAHGDDLRLVVFDNSNDRYHIAAASDPATPLTNPIAGQPYRVTYGQGNAATLINVTLDSYSLNGDDQLGFNLYGGLDQPTAATITLECDGLTVTVSVDPNTGEASIGAIN